jgi:hypothetical protein
MLHSTPDGLGRVGIFAVPAEQISDQDERRKEQALNGRWYG